MSSKRIEVASAILYKDGQFLMQLREDIPGILYPGCWVFFGGHLEAGETPEIAIQRELLEEMGYCPPQLIRFGCYCDANLIGYVFHACLDVEFHPLVLKEGWDMGWVTVAQIRQGWAYSEKAGEVRPLGHPHQKILLDFLGQGIPCGLA